MTSSQFQIGLLGEPDYSDDGKTRLRYIVADAFSRRASEWRKLGRPDKASRLQWLVSRIETGQQPTKRVLGKCAKDIESVKLKLTNV